MLRIDIELTNRCNAACSFCPRDAMPHEGIMQPEVFERSLARALELQAFARQLTVPLDPTIVFCGTGEPLVNRQAVHYVRRVRESGLSCQLSTNGSLLSAEKASALLDAGLTWINVNVSDIGEDYERVYQLPFAPTRDNLIRFIALAPGRCVVCIIVVDHRRDPAHLRAIEAYWRSLGADVVLRFGLANRGGSLRSADVELAAAPADDRTGARHDRLEPRPICPAPFMHLFIGYDGQYYLCSSDWQKEVGLGSVFDTSFAAIAAEKLARVSSREPICKRCSLDPVNILRHQHAPDATASRPFDATLDELLANDRGARSLAHALIAGQVASAT
jgi:MoaA/NifB/PqqE/SkfB family radical SAM enzyme